MNVDEDEWVALRMLRPELGDLAEEPRKLIPQLDEEFPGLTFDFVGRRPDGQHLAIEITMFLDQRFVEAAAALDRVASRLASELRLRGAPPAKYWLGTVALVDDARVRARDLQIGVLVEAALRCEPGEEISVSDHVDVYRHVEDVLETSVEVVFAGETDLDGSPSERAKRVLADNRPKLARAGLSGFETHLGVTHWGAPTPDALWRAADLDDLGGAHPMHIWTIDVSPRATLPIRKIR
jgi:hypothetical protein